MWKKIFDKKNPAIRIRPWEPVDIPRIAIIENQADTDAGEPEPVPKETLYRWVENELIYGIVLTENGSVKGFAAAFLPKMPQVIMRALRVDKDRRKHGYGTLMLNHFFAALDVWGKSFLEIDVSERNEGLRRFLMKEGNGFVITALSEFFDKNGDPAEAFYQMQCPAPYGFKPGDMRILVEGNEVERDFQKRP